MDCISLLFRVDYTLSRGKVIAGEIILREGGEFRSHVRLNGKILPLVQQGVMRMKKGGENEQSMD